MTASSEIREPSLGSVKLKAIVVDDEMLDRRLLCNLIREYCYSIKIMGEAENIMEARQMIASIQPDVVFLDINMPNGNGFDLLENFGERKFRTVFTSGHSEFGIKAVKSEAFDYLLKPLDVDELQQTEKRLLKSFETGAKRERYIRLFHQNEHLMMRIADIVFVEAEGSYVKLYLADSRVLLLCKNIKQFMKEINEETMLRVHRSFVVNTGHIKSFKNIGSSIILTLTTGHNVKVSRAFKSLLRKELSTNLNTM